MNGQSHSTRNDSAPPARTVTGLADTTFGHLLVRYFLQHSGQRHFMTFMPVLVDATRESPTVPRADERVVRLGGGAAAAHSRHTSGARLTPMTPTDPGSSVWFCHRLRGSTMFLWLEPSNPIPVLRPGRCSEELNGRNHPEFSATFQKRAPAIHKSRCCVYGSLRCQFHVDDRRSRRSRTAHYWHLPPTQAAARRARSIALGAMCGIRQQIGLTTVGCRVVAVPITVAAEADSAATCRAVRRGIGHHARRRGAASAVVGIVVDVDFPAVVREAITIPIIFRKQPATAHSPLLPQVAVVWASVQGMQESDAHPVCGSVLDTHLSLQSF